VTGALALMLGMALAADGSVEASVQADVRGRNVKVPDGPWTRFLEASAAPALEGRLGWGDDQLVGRYGPLLVAPDVPGRVDVLQVARLEGLARPRPGLTLGGQVVGLYGTSSLVREARQTGAAGAVVSSTGSLRRSELRVAADARWAARHGSEATARLAQEYGGGLDAASQLLLPVRRAWLLDLAWMEQAGRRDQLELAIAASDTRYQVGARTILLTSSLTWRHRLTPRLETVVGGQVGVAYTEPVGLQEERSLVVGGEAGLLHQRPERRGSDRLIVRATPQVDRLTGIVEERVELELRSEGALGVGWWLGIRTVGGTHVREGPDVRTGHAEARLERRISEHLTAGGGLYGVWQETAAVDLPSFIEAGAFATVIWRSGRL